MSEPLDSHDDAPGRARFVQVFVAQRARMERLVSRRVGCRATAADLVQELFLRFWRRPQVEVEALDTYLLRCAGNIAIDHGHQCSVIRQVASYGPKPIGQTIALTRAGNTHKGQLHPIFRRHRLLP